MKCAVFKTGFHSDMSGKTIREWTDADLDQIISRYDPVNHEAPVVVGHPKTNSPAYGWVSGLTREGGVLYAEFKQLNPEFLDMLKSGSFKKRSISLYPDLSLRHIGFLGAIPPAIKGLPDMQFAAGAEITIEFQEETHIMEFKEFFEALKFWKEATAAEAAPIDAKDEGKAVSFSEADIEKAKKEAADAERDRLTLEFAEKAAKTQRDACCDAIKGRVTQMVESGKVIPAWVKAGLTEFMIGLDMATEIEFSEGKKQTPLQWFENFLAELPKVVDFGEAAKDDGRGTGDPAEKLEALIKQKQDADKTLSYSEAFAAVQLENMDLVSNYING